MSIADAAASGLSAEAGQAPIAAVSAGDIGAAEATALQQQADTLVQQLTDAAKAAEALSMDSNIPYEIRQELSANAQMLRGAAAPLMTANPHALKAALPSANVALGMVGLNKGDLNDTQAKLDEEAARKAMSADAAAAAAAGVSLASYQASRSFLNNYVDGFSNLSQTSQDYFTAHTAKMVENDPNLKSAVDAGNAIAQDPVLSNIQKQQEEKAAQANETLMDRASQQNDAGLQEMLKHIQEMEGAHGPGGSRRADARLIEIAEKYKSGDLNYEEMRAQVSALEDKVEYAHKGALMKSFETMSDQEKQAIANKLGKDVNDVTGEDLDKAFDKPLNLRDPKVKEEIDKLTQQVKENGFDSLGDEDKLKLAQYDLQMGKRQAMGAYNVSQFVQNLSPEQQVEFEKRREAIANNTDVDFDKAKAYGSLLEEYGMDSKQAHFTAKALAGMSAEQFKSYSSEAQDQLREQMQSNNTWTYVSEAFYNSPTEAQYRNYVDQKWNSTDPHDVALGTLADKVRWKQLDDEALKAFDNWESKHPEIKQQMDDLKADGMLFDKPEIKDPKLRQELEIVDSAKALDKAAMGQELSAKEQAYVDKLKAACTDENGKFDETKFKQMQSKILSAAYTLSNEKIDVSKANADKFPKLVEEWEKIEKEGKAAGLSDEQILAKQQAAADKYLEENGYNQTAAQKAACEAGATTQTAGTTTKTPATAEQQVQEAAITATTGSNASGAGQVKEIQASAQSTTTPESTLAEQKAMEKFGFVPSQLNDILALGGVLSIGGTMGGHSQLGDPPIQTAMSADHAQALQQQTTQVG